jgi:acyl-CoA thioester hydrolase
VKDTAGLDPAAPDPGLAGTDDRPVPGIDNGYRVGYRVRFDEAGPDGRLRTSGLLRYAQDVAWRHSEHLGFDRSWYTVQGRWWIVRAVEVEVVEPVALGTTLRVSTAVVGHRRIWARRLVELRLPDGRPAARVATDWVILDERGRLGRIPADFGVAFPNPELDGEATRVTPPPPPADAMRHAVRVRPPDIDPMGHVNNAVYLDWLEEAVTAAGAAPDSAVVPRRVRIEYAASAEPGDELVALAWQDGGSWWHRLVRPADGAELVRAELRPG